MADESERSAVLDTLRSYAANLQADIERLKDDLIAVRRSISLLESSQASLFPVSDAGETIKTADQSGYARRGPTTAMLRFLRQNAPERFKASAMANEFRKLGVRGRNGTNFSNVVASTAMRLTKNGTIKAEKDGEDVYLFSFPDEETNDE